MLNRQIFFAKVRPMFGGSLNQGQVSGMEAVLNYWEECKDYSDLRWLAYMFATDYHETAGTMQAIEEYGKGKGRTYGQKIKMSRLRYTTPDKLYYGRGLVQLTWYENYQLMGRLLGIPLLEHPEMALQMSVAVKIMFEGMLRASSSFGDFTGKSLEMYFNKNTNDPYNARKIINGLDKAALIAKYHTNTFLPALKAAS